MGNKLILLFSHKLTDEQIESSKNELNVKEFIYLPDELQNIWSNIPPKLNSIDEYLTPIKIWIKSVANDTDYILIQGDFGATYIMVNWAFDNNYIPIYATTNREFKEVKKDGEINIIRKFSHCIFRKYNE